MVIILTRERELGRKLRITRQRRVILETLMGSKSHPTADEVYRMVRRRLPHISLGTVYRNLEVLSEAGLIRKLELGGKQRRFDGQVGDHYHVRCVRCGRMGDVSLRRSLGVERAARRATDYTVTGHRLEFVGICPACGAAASRREGCRAHRETVGE